MKQAQVLHSMFLRRLALLCCEGSISLLMRGIYLRDIYLIALVEMATEFNSISCALYRVRLVTGEEFAFKCT